MRKAQVDGAIAVALGVLSGGVLYQLVSPAAPFCQRLARMPAGFSRGMNGLNGNLNI